MKKLILLLATAFIAFFSVKAQREVTGRVTDANGTPLAGVSVNIKGSPKGTATGPDGSFKISALSNAVIIFTNIGFADKEVTADNSSLNVSWNRHNAASRGSDNRLCPTKQETGGRLHFKIIRRRSEIDASWFVRQSVTGQSPGVLSQSQSGQPGAAAVVTIRGKGSINGSNTPLYIIDGVSKCC
jgi:hypothetical protein